MKQTYAIDILANDVSRVCGLWSAIIGAILFDVFGNYACDTPTDPEELLRAHVDALADTMGH